ncbi:winged helix-turn-helix transcriptional regulator [Microbaculum marinisediminis]|uniref:Helix-turn-helix transcriptional regulator n=1 Tax=Microbaculum marinisediminis TaxID=2931392 RepID=A0AAW5QTT3_9HYPH|nr:helix-turn-helix domain-containing protein [Microbaculum sp. A6E488]MCT8971297.1 helix-turn-helix transcriptional regulator [Microbaculum sp. A6E488]
MKTYGQFCPVAKASEVFCERWTALILRELATGATRFAQVQRGVPLASPTILSRRLKALEAEGIVERRRSKTGRSWTYHLTPAGQDFAPIVEALGIWGQKWSRRTLQEHEIDLGLLLWALEKDVRPQAFGRGRAVVHFDFHDRPLRQRHWWFVNENGACEMCVDDPGHEVDLHLTVSLPDMIYIWRGDLSLSHALESGRLEADGSTPMRRHLRDWLGICSLAHVKSERDRLAPAS